MTTKGKWTVNKLIQVVKTTASGFFYNPYAWSNDGLKKAVKLAKKKGLVYTIRTKKDQIEVKLKE